MINDYFFNSLVFDLSTEGTNAWKYRIIGITIKTVEEEKIFTDRDEKKVLEDFWAYVKEKKIQTFVGFNSEQFDIPFLKIRSVKYGIPIIDIEGKSIDLRRLIVGNVHQKKGRLRDFKELLGIEFKESNEWAKMHMSILWECKIPELKDYLLEDVKLTWALFEKVSEMGMLK